MLGVVCAAASRAQPPTPGEASLPAQPLEHSRNTKSGTRATLDLGLQISPGKRRTDFSHWWKCISAFSSGLKAQSCHDRVNSPAPPSSKNPKRARSYQNGCCLTGHWRKPPHKCPSSPGYAHCMATSDV